MTKSIEDIVAICEKKIMMALLSELPTPTCPLKKQQNEWKKDQVKKTLAARLGHPGLGITVNIDVK
jgi:hypothetical protein